MKTRACARTLSNLKKRLSAYRNLDNVGACTKCGAAKMGACCECDTAKWVLAARCGEKEHICARCCESGVCNKRDSKKGYRLRARHCESGVCNECDAAKKVLVTCAMLQKEFVT